MDGEWRDWGETRWEAIMGGPRKVGQQLRKDQGQWG